jgi:hypothetical protein
MEKIMVLVLLSLACESITEIVGGSELFKPLRSFFISREVPFISKLLQCKYCLSVWIAGLVASLWFFFVEPKTNPVIFIFIIFAVHRVSNLYHLVWDIVGDYRRERWLVPLNFKDGGK